jgi:hypothetical protein
MPETTGMDQEAQLDSLSDGKHNSAVALWGTPQGYEYYEHCSIYSTVITVVRLRKK